MKLNNSVRRLYTTSFCKINIYFIIHRETNMWSSTSWNISAKMENDGSNLKIDEDKKSDSQECFHFCFQYIISDDQILSERQKIR